jgi:hypothetical protein
MTVDAVNGCRGHRDRVIGNLRAAQDRLGCRFCRHARTHLLGVAPCCGHPEGPRGTVEGGCPGFERYRPNMKADPVRLEMERNRT